nr:MAG TPA: hypothetical protein [Caudoviricetes sp.]DAY85520.1 MAG TPA: hypothetical protein [Caudoviricetes sp.]
MDIKYRYGGSHVSPDKRNLIRASLLLLWSEKKINI